MAAGSARHRKVTGKHSGLVLELARAVENAHPLAHCCACLAARLNVDEFRLRDMAQLLLFHERRRFLLMQRTCANCGETDEMLFLIEPGAS